jgi:hypothetical protein
MFWQAESMPYSPDKRAFPASKIEIQANIICGTLIDIRANGGIRK